MNHSTSKPTKAEQERLDAIHARDRFWRLVRTGLPEDCWPWTGWRNNLRGGYGQYVINGGRYRAHRIAYILSQGDIPAGAVICHTCDNPPCCNPAHLFAATQRENLQDGVAKGRITFVHPHGLNRGSRNGNARLSDDKVRLIRSAVLAKRGDASALARSLGIVPSVIGPIRARKRWKHVI